MNLNLTTQKPFVIIVLVLLTGTSGFGATNYLANSETSIIALEIDNKIQEHIMNENSHPITSYKIESLIEKIDNLTLENKSLKTSIDKLTLTLCAHDEYDCDFNQ